jgi:hypothetical protein
MEPLFTNDPLLASMQRRNTLPTDDYRRKVEMIGSRTPIWDKIDAEVSAMTDQQREMLLQDEDYIAVNAELEQIIQAQLLRIVKPQVEGSEQGREVLMKVQDTLQVVKRRVQEHSNKEMQLFRQWQAFSAANPNATYNDFMNAINKKKK